MLTSRLLGMRLLATVIVSGVETLSMVIFGHFQSHE
jgi:hypothetical protein